MPYRTGRAGIGLVIGSGGVGGSGVVRVSATAPLAPEVKYIEGGFTTPAAGTAGAWVTLNNLLAANIVQGTGSNNRIGKNIRIVETAIYSSTPDLTESKDFVAFGLVEKVFRPRLSFQFWVLLVRHWLMILH